MWLRRDGNYSAGRQRALHCGWSPALGLRVGGTRSTPRNDGATRDDLHSVTRAGETRNHHHRPWKQSLLMALADGNVN
jgi:hypothetical protein